MSDELNEDEGKAIEVESPEAKKHVDDEPDQAESEDEEEDEDGDDEVEPEEEEPKEEEPVEEKPKASSEDDELIELADGTKVTFSELTAGYMKDADYRRKTAEIAEMRRAASQSVTPKAEESQRTTPSDLISKYDQKGLEEFKALARELGFVSKEDLTTMKNEERKNEVINNFFVSHPEYKPENDPGDLRYTALREELALYNLSEIKNLPKAFEKAHQEVTQKFMKPAEQAKALAVRERVKAATVGSRAGGSKPAPKETSKQYTEAQLAVMREMGLED